MVFLAGGNDLPCGVERAIGSCKALFATILCQHTHAQVLIFFITPRLNAAGAGVDILNSRVEQERKIPGFDFCHLTSIVDFTSD